MSSQDLLSARRRARDGLTPVRPMFWHGGLSDDTILNIALRVEALLAS